MNYNTDNKTNNYKTSAQLENWLAHQMLQSQQLNKSNTKQEDLQQSSLKFEFVDLKDLSVDVFLRFQQMENPAYSIVFVNHTASKPNYLKLKIEGETKCIPFKKIIRLEACCNYTRFYLSNSIKPVLTSKTLKYYVELLGENDFVRPHQSHLVNSNFIDQVVLKPKPYLVLKDGKKIFISRRKIGIFKT